MDQEYSFYLYCRVSCTISSYVLQPAFLSKVRDNQQELIILWMQKALNYQLIKQLHFVHVSTQIIGSTCHHIILKLQKHSSRAALELLITLYPY